MRNVQNAIFGERKDFETGKTDSNFNYATKAVRGLDADDVTFGVFRTSNKDAGIRAGQSCGPIDGPSWRQAFLDPSDKPVSQEMIDDAIERYRARKGNGSTGSVLDSTSADKDVESRKRTFSTYGADLKSAEQDRKILANAKASEGKHPYTGKPMKPLKVVQPIQGNQAVEPKKEITLKRERISQKLERSVRRQAAFDKRMQARYEKCNNGRKFKRGLRFGVDKAEYESAIAQVGEHAEAAQELRRFVPEHSRSWNKSGLRNPKQTHKQG